jgi:hypothetical protein
VPLTNKQKASLALRVVIARFLDDFAALDGAAEQSKALEIACSRLGEWIARTDGEVETHKELQQHLKCAAAALESLLNQNARFPRERIEAAIAEIHACATGAQPSDGDGHARLRAAAPPPCLCGFLDLARRIEEHARDWYASVESSLPAWPEISYRTEITPDNLKRLEPFKVAGGAEIDTVRRVTLTVKDVKLSAVDLCQIAYVLFHEVVCHGFQGVVQEQSANAKPQCHWTEGWMDSVAYRMAVASALPQAVTSPLPQADMSNWLPLAGPDAEDAMGAVHRARYPSPPGLKAGDAKARRAARVAYTRLPSAFLDTGVASSPHDAQILAQKFSLLANAQADSRSLLKLSTILQTLLLRESGNDDRLYASNACLVFLEHRDLKRLLTELQTLPKASAKMPAEGAIVAAADVKLTAKAGTAKPA